MEGCFNVKVHDLERDNHLAGHGYMVGEPMKVAAYDKSERLQIRCGVVCTVSDFYYLNVSPSDVQWITDDIGVFFDVESNVEWRILT